MRERKREGRGGGVRAVIATCPWPAELRVRCVASCVGGGGGGGGGTLGDKMAEFPLDPQLGKMLLASPMYS